MNMQSILDLYNEEQDDRLLRLATRVDNNRASYFTKWAINMMMEDPKYVEGISVLQLVEEYDRVHNQ